MESQSLLLAERVRVCVQQVDVAVEAEEPAEVLPAGCVEVEPVLPGVEQAGLGGEAAHPGRVVHQAEDGRVPGVQSGLGTTNSGGD